MGLLRRPTPVGIVEGRRLGRTCGPARIRAHLKNQVAATPPIPHSTAISSSSIVGAGPVRMLTARQRGASATGTTPQPCDPTPPAWQAPTRVMPATSSGSGVVSPASMRADAALSPDQGEDRSPGLGACWLPTPLAGRSRTCSRPRSEPGSGHCVDRRPHQQRRWS
jgi:hypothetical protein